MLKPLIIKSLNLLLGVAIGILLHYFLYRYSIPAKAFIYVAF